MNWQQFLNFFSRKPQLIRLLTLYSFFPKIRLGNHYDGGYVIADEFGPYDCYLSAGVGDDASFCAGFIEKYSPTEAAAFDGTIKSLPENFPKGMEFVPKNIGPYESEQSTNLAPWLERNKNVFLKMDIEGGEIAWLNSIDRKYLKSIKQIVIEFHGICDDTWDALLIEKINALKKITRDHIMIHVHGNNNGPLVQYQGYTLPHVIEFTLIRKSDMKNSLVVNTQSLPIENIDFSNRVGEVDYSLDYPPFTYSL